MRLLRKPLPWLASGTHIASHGTDDADFPTVLCNHHRPLSERSPLRSLRQTTLNSADFTVGTGDARGDKIQTMVF